jgi:hypothetical protein
VNLTSDKTDFKTKLEETKEGHITLVKGTNHQKDITVRDTAPDASTPSFIKETLLGIIKT